MTCLGVQFEKRNKRVRVRFLRPEGDANGAPHPDPQVYAKKFPGKYERLPQEAPKAFAQAVIDVQKP
jgi:hypothetical protein